MDWNSIIMALLSGTTVAGIVEAIRYRKQNLRIKDSEATQSDVEAQKSQMNLGEEYMKKVYELSEMNYQATLKNGTDNANIIAKVDAIAEEQRMMASFLNGEYAEFKRKQKQEV